MSVDRRVIYNGRVSSANMSPRLFMRLYHVLFLFVAQFGNISGCVGLQGRWEVHFYRRMPG